MTRPERFYIIITGSGQTELEFHSVSDLKTILVVDDDRMILRLAKEALSKRNGAGAPAYNVKTALNGEDALEIIDQEPVDLVLTDLKMPVMDGYALLALMNNRYRDIPVIVMTGYGSAEMFEQLKQKGVFDYVEKPFDINELRGKIAQTLDNDSKGFIHGFTLANFLQAVQVEEKTITLKITSRGRVGYLHLLQGELINAESQGAKGLDAAYEILGWRDPQIEMKGLLSKNRVIKKPLMRLLLEYSRLKDEAPRPMDGSGAAENPDLSKAIFLAEGHHFKAAHKMLTDFVKKTPRCADGWFWYSRIIVNPKSIEAALGNAVKLNPKAPHIRQEMAWFQKAKPMLGESPTALKSETIRRCPFCWGPIPARLVQCALCKSFMSFHDGLFSGPPTADPKIVKNAIARYERIVYHERNLTAYYYLGLGHLNAGNWEDALGLFHKMVNLAPEKKIFAYQLRRLLAHVASLEPKISDGTDETPAPQQIVGDEKDCQKRILVVEDSPTTRKVIAITLGQQGYEVIEAKDGFEALSKLNDSPPHLILLDIVLPRIDGYAVLDIIKKQDQFKDVPVIMLTSKDGVLNRWKGRRAGSTAYLTKPFDPKKLVETIEKHL